MLTQTKSIARKLLPAKVTWPVMAARGSWSAQGYVSNFGDQLTPLLIKNMFGIPIKKSGFGEADLFGVGSILDSAARASNNLRPYIWGSGFIADGHDWASFPVRVRAVRGHLTLSRLHQYANSAVTIGDPGVLTPLVFPGLMHTVKRYEISLVPHWSDMSNEKLAVLTRRDPKINIINPISPAVSVIEQITASRFIASSSLHGLVIADAFGIPNAWTVLGGWDVGGDYKFHDYYSAYNKKATAFQLQDVVAECDALRRDWRQFSSIKELQLNLLKSFPSALRT